MIDKIKKTLCTGCYACFNICPENCIEMSADESGFKYPKVDYTKCIKCKKCVDVCPSLNKPSYIGKKETPKIVAAWSLDKLTRETSTSGGIFTELAKIVIENNGAVVGARYNENHLVEHYITQCIEGVNKLKQSKYVQSDVGIIFNKVLRALDKGTTVAFCGTPCQVAGLLNFLGSPYDNLITIDFVCRGVNSPKAYNSYLNMLEKKYKSKIAKVWFKNKKHGWNRFSTRVDFENGKTYLKDRYSDLYMRGYIEENLYVRSSCFECKYKGFPRIADLSLADFWGVANENPDLDSDQGTSLIMVNSLKGEELLTKVSDRVFQKELLLKHALPGNSCIYNSIKKNDNSSDFLLMLDKEPFDKCFYKYANNIGLMREIKKIKRLVRKIL